MNVFYLESPPRRQSFLPKTTDTMQFDCWPMPVNCQLVLSTLVPLFTSGLRCDVPVVQDLVALGAWATCRTDAMNHEVDRACPWHQHGNLAAGSSWGKRLLMLCSSLQSYCDSGAANERS